MVHYQPIKPWCELILYRHMPWSVAGQWRGISLLFPMEKLFERYVAASLSRALLPTAKLTEQAARLFLCDHDGGRMFQLQPDLLIEDRGMRWVLDTKWKRIDSQNRTDKYSLSQADFYQLFAYGQKYLQGRGELVLIYPRRAAFHDPLPVFEFNESLRLWVLPFDLERRELIGVAHPGLPLRGASVITGMAGIA